MRRSEVSASTTREGGRGFLEWCFEILKVDVFKKEVAVCQNKLDVPAQLRVGFWIGNCATFGNADGYTGWNSVSRIFVEEVPKSASLKAAL